MLRFIFLSVFALLLLTACGDGLTDQESGQEPVNDTSSQDFNNVFRNTTGAGSIAEFLNQPNPKSCPECDLFGVDLTGADLSEAYLCCQDSQPRDGHSHR
jgi:hypothetical protein